MNDMEGKEGKLCDCELSLYQDCLIPFSLPHTGNTNSHWKGLFGRVTPTQMFKTVTTRNNPMNKVGRWLHYRENRLVSVRECARAQGFPDNFQFAGSLADKQRQIGNAVPPPLAEAIGREIVSMWAEELKEEMDRY